MTRPLLTIALVSAVTGCKPTNTPANQRASILTTTLRETWGMETKVECPADMTQPCKAQGPHGELALETPDAKAGGKTVVVSGADGFYMPTSRIAQSTQKRFASEDVRCGDKKYVILPKGAPAYCELWTADALDRLLRLELVDVATQEWKLSDFNTPAAGLREAIAKISFTADVYCEPLKLQPGATANCTITAANEAPVAVKATFEKGVTVEFLNDAVILPAVVTNATGEMPLSCAKRVAKRDEKVRCSFTFNDQPQDVEVSVNAAGETEISPLAG